MSLPTNRVRVVLLTQAIGPLDYRLPDDMTAGPGCVVMVPLGPRKLPGVIWDDDVFGDEAIAASKLRPVLELVECPPLGRGLRRLINWVADYYLTSHAAVLRMVLSSSAAFTATGTIIEYRRTGFEPARLTPQRAAALDALEGAQGLVRELAAEAGVSDAVIRGLIKAGAFEPVTISVDSPLPEPLADFDTPKLNDAQQLAANSMVEAIRAGGFDTFVLDGVTGSGKTETYFEAVAEAIRLNTQVLVLLPEIALTAPFLARFEARFGVEPAVWHSNLRSTQRRRVWRAVADGSAKVLVGARSALFLPFTNLRLIIVDEAHETSFKQEDGVRYHARDVAVMRGHFEGFPVVLASATPALESRHMVAIGRYKGLEIPSRFGAAKMPEIKAIDLTLDAPDAQHWIAPTLLKALEERVERGEQSLLFLNRRGYAPLTLCRTRGHRFQCPNCTSWMVEHRLVRRLACHHCGHVMPPPEQCPECGESDTLVACGPGVERISDEVNRLLPQARTIVATSDTLWSPEKAAEFVSRVENRAVDIIIGTQLVTKGYHFPELTLVGVIDADLGLEGGDLRAAERTFQQIAQAAGRAGRGEKPGEVFIQTRNPNHPVIAALVAGDRDAFYDAETEQRKSAGAPPFGRFAAIIISSEDEREAIEAARAVGGAAPQVDGMIVYGPAPAPLAMLRGRYRQRLLVHAQRSVEVQNIIREWLGGLQFPRGVRVGIDVDPYSFL
ncbi:primosomal protein N' [Sphingorhabdus sp. EL138]|uniref:primosomal protein N' n=1 Tax=Sphingorhabdus sp. EL138 TaxID=2073156 RepID=UPI0025F31B92|nr:primosomal protein N' [Sphingorhabdus sp. EL138]